MRLTKQRTPLVVRLNLALLERGPLAIARSLMPRRRELGAVARAFACRRPEERFARLLLQSHTRLWLFRVNQGLFAGDFVVVNMAQPRMDARVAMVLELKQDEPLRLRSSATHQLRNAQLAVRAVASASQALATTAEYHSLSGGALQLIEALAIRRCDRSRERIRPWEPGRPSSSRSCHP